MSPLKTRIKRNNGGLDNTIEFVNKLKMSYQDIPLIKVHRCSEACAVRWAEQLVQDSTNIFTMWQEPNPDYKDGQCEKLGQQEDTNIHIESFDVACSDMYLGEKVIITEPTLTIVLDYPLNRPYRHEVTRNTGHSINSLLHDIQVAYKHVYETEASTTAEPELTAEQRMAQGSLINRNRTNGTYGIWGHDMGDLYVESIEYDTEKKEILLCMGS